MPTAPNFKNQVDWWEANKPGDTYGDFNRRMASSSSDYLKAGLAPVAGGAGGFKSAIGWDDSYPDINNPSTVKDLGSWNRLMQSNVANATDAATNRMANVGIRGGFGATGGPSQRSQIAAQGLSTVAGTTSQNLTTAMEYLRQKALYDADAAKLYTQYMGQIMGTGANLAGLNLQGLKAGADEQAGWRAGAGQANASDINRWNQWEAGGDQRAREAQQWADSRSAMNDKFNQQQLWRQITMPGSGYGAVGTGQPSEYNTDQWAYLKGPYQNTKTTSSTGFWG